MVRACGIVCFSLCTGMWVRGEGKERWKIRGGDIQGGGLGVGGGFGCCGDVARWKQD